MDTTEPATPKPKRGPVALLVGLVSGIAAAALWAPVSDWAMQEHHVSNMEGGRAYAVIGLWIPLAFIVGGIVGFAVSLQVKGLGFVGYLFKQGIAIAIVVLLVGLGAGISYEPSPTPEATASPNESSSP
ncbi:MAG: hypothetical protein M3119_03510 [Verrucomicrobiota bacterium]|nr:hypothetical protein [Verrucomicrobiota bacterium]